MRKDKEERGQREKINPRVIFIDERLYKTGLVIKKLRETKKNPLLFFSHHVLLQRLLLYPCCRL